jgi:HDOD domain
MRILLVDGDEAFPHQIRRAFWKRHRSWEVLLATNGREALEVLATDPASRYKAILEQAQSSRIPLAVLEHDTYSIDHAQIGAHLLSLWGLPPAFCRPVREHHAPPSTSGADFPLSKALHLADARHGGGRTAGIFADGRWGLHPHVLQDPERFAH